MFHQLYKSIIIQYNAIFRIGGIFSLFFFINLQNKITLLEVEFVEFRFLGLHFKKIIV